MNVSRYLDRLGYGGASDATVATLDQLIEHHLAVVPFENIDIVRLHRPIVLDRQRHFGKIVGERRGGFCYELNGLFAGLLEALGYGVTQGYAVWPNCAGIWTEPFDHLVLSATIPATGERLLVDVGFGADCPVVAVPLDEGRVRAVDRADVEAYRAQRMVNVPDGWRIEVMRPGAAWTLVYEADLTDRPITAFRERCDYLQSSPNSHFTRSLLCSRPLPNGRATLAEDQFILTTDGNRIEQLVSGTGDELAVLRDWFAIEIDPARYGARR